MIRRIAGMPGIDWTGFNPNKKEHRAGVSAKVQEFVSAAHVEQRKFTRGKTSEFTTKGMTEDMFSAQNVVDVIQTDVADIDLGWQAAFDMVDLRGMPKSSFDIMDVSSGLTFTAVRSGGAAKIYGVSGDKTTVSMSLYGGGLAFERIWWDDQDYYKVEEATADFRFKFFDVQATTFYTLLADTTNDVAFDSDDVTTISNAAAELLNDLFKTLPMTAGSELLLYFNPALQKRAFAALNGVLAYTNEKNMRFNVRPIMSPYVTSSTYFWLVLPGRKNKWGNRMDLSILGETDIVRYAENIVGWGRYGGQINTDQIRRLALS